MGQKPDFQRGRKLEFAPLTKTFKQQNPLTPYN